jgi:hypothetical protein
VLFVAVYSGRGLRAGDRPDAFDVLMRFELRD